MMLVTTLAYFTAFAVGFSIGAMAGILIAAALRLAAKDDRENDMLDDFGMGDPRAVVHDDTVWRVRG